MREITEEEGSSQEMEMQYIAQHLKAKCEKNQQPGHAFWSDGFIWQRSKNQTTKEKLRSDAKSRQRKIINRICKNLKRNEKKIAALDHLPDMNLELRLFLCSKDWEPGKIKMQ